MGVLIPWRVGKGPDVLDQWVETSCRRLNKTKYQVLYLGHNSVMWHYRLRVEWLESCQLENELGILVDNG